MADDLRVGRADASGTAVIGRDVVIGEDVEIGANVVIHDGTRIGDGCVLQDNVVVGKQPKLSSRSTSARRPLDPLVLEPGVVVCTGAVVYAGTILGEGVIVGDLASVRERCTVGARSVVGRGTCVENDVIIGAGCSIQSNCYITRYCVLEDDVFIAPCVTTTNDNFMGRTEARHALLKGATIRRGARVGGGVVILPGIEIGEEAFIAAGALVTKDVPAAKVVAGLPAQVWRDVPEEQLRASGG
jgi:acetyltransferase-like isoleucine patch superfamily enzyme